MSPSLGRIFTALRERDESVNSTVFSCLRVQITCRYHIFTCIDRQQSHIQPELLPLAVRTAERPLSSPGRWPWKKSSLESQKHQWHLIIWIFWQNYVLSLFTNNRMNWITCLPQFQNVGLYSLFSLLTSSEWCSPEAGSRPGWRPLHLPGDQWSLDWK